MDYKLIPLILAILFLIAAFRITNDNNRYAFEHIPPDMVFVGDSRTGKSWICVTEILNKEMKDKNAYRNEMKDKNGCLEFAYPQ